MRYLILKSAVAIVLVCFTAISYGHQQRLNQGWTDSSAAQYYRISEGSELMPYSWFVSLESSTGNSPLSASLEKFGLIYDRENKFLAEPELPVGFTIHENELTEKLYGEKKWVGVNCSACHTTQLRIGGKSFIVDGGTNFFDIQEFEKEIVNSVVATLKDQEKFDRFVSQLNLQPIKDVVAIQKLKDNMALFKAEFENWSKTNHTWKDSSGTLQRYGPSRIDGIGGPTNDLICAMHPRLGDAILTATHNIQSNCRSSHMPSSIPHLWGITDAEFVQWDGAVHSSLGRNWGQSTGTYAKNWIENDLSGKLRFRSTAIVEGLYELEKSFKTLKSPEWNELVRAGMAEPLDLNLVKAGSAIFKNRCSQCHAVQPEFTTPNKFGNSYWKSKNFAADIVGTEPNYLIDNKTRTATLPTAYADAFKEQFGSSSITPENSVNAGLYRSFMIRKMITDIFEIKNFSLMQMAALTNCRDGAASVQTQIGYKARSIEGIVFTPPYLHNGSVQNIYELLLPAAQRKKKFFVGCYTFDVGKLMFDCKESDMNSFEFDTTFSGNSNAGHEYGTDMEEAEKTSLIEYIKSLNHPSSPTKNPMCN